MVSGAQVKMEYLEPVSQQRSIFAQDEMQRAWKSYPIEHTFSAKSFSITSSNGENFLGWSQNSSHRNKRNKAARVPTDSGQQVHAVPNHSYIATHDGSIGSCDLDYEVSKVDRSNSKNPKAKLNKKGRLHKKSLLSCSFDAATSSKPIHDFEDKNDAAFDVFLNENIVKKFDGWGVSDDVLSSSLTPTASISYSDELYESETPYLLPQDFSEDFCSDQLGLDVSPCQIKNVHLSTFVGEMTKRRLKQSIDDISSGACSLDSFSDGCNTDISTPRSDGLKFQIPAKGANGSRHSNSRMVEDVDCRESSNAEIGSEGAHGRLYNFKKRMSRPNHEWSKVVGDSESNTSEAKCNSIESHSIKSGKRNGKEKKFRQNSSGMHKHDRHRDTHGRKGKENNHCVWQRVQRNDTDGFTNELKRMVHADSPPDVSKEVPLHQKHDKPTCMSRKQHGKITRSIVIDEMAADTEDLSKVPSIIDSHSISLKSNDGNLRTKVSEKSKRKTSSGCKQEHNHHLRKGLHGDKTDAIGPTVMNMHQNKIFKQRIYRQPHCIPESASHCQSSSFSDGIDISSSEPLQNSQILSQDSKSIPNACSVASDIHAPVAQTLMISPSLTLGSLEQIHKKQSQHNSEFQRDSLEVSCPTLADILYEPKRFETNNFVAENSNQDHNSELFGQKWVPVGKKETCVLDRSIPDNLSACHVYEPPKNGLYLKNSETGQARFYSNLPSTNDGLSCWGYESDLGNSLYPRVEGQQAEKLRSQTPSVQEKQSCTDDKLSCCIWKGQKYSKFETDAFSTFEIGSYMISQMVSDTYKKQIESEGIQLATCSPLAEFERLLHAASPVIELKNYFQNCWTCLGDQPIGNALCSHQIPDVPLQSLWQWYEVPGIYGLEVKAEDHQTLKRLGSNQNGFCAYLVPFLSAVQLLGHCQCCTCSDNGCHNSDRNTASENSSDPGQLPMLPMLLPKPQREQAGSSSQPFDSLSTCDPSVSSNQHKFCDESVTRAHHDPELLFEYFESEQPYHRRTLFEKIQELIRADATSDSPVFGDPSTLNWHLPDLHPSSWYSVAWYPIYRIPDGNFRAAFLTYHSLGHFVKRVTLDGVTCIVSPVVGLQSYNAQEECWFELRKSAVLQAEENAQFDHFEILKERLQTLERTASAMARASVRKADHKSINRHPDYEFFLSRRRGIFSLYGPSPISECLHFNSKERRGQHAVGVSFPKSAQKHKERFVSG
ncbi:hypothetical protein ACLOJK_017152 [Asimina triloba]